MNSSSHKRLHLKKEKKLSKLIKSHSGSESEESEHELSFYLNDRVKLMKEILKIISSKKIRSMAPEFLRKLDTEEINSMLLEELLGISNKRLKYIFNGQILNEESSSTDPEDQAVDVISLDDISDDDLVIDLDSDSGSKRRTHKHRHRVKEEHERKKIKKEKLNKEHSSKKHSENDNPMSESNLMSVLELLELQARARAIKSQLALEAQISKEQETAFQESDVNDDDDEDAVIVETPKNEEILITSSEDEETSKTEVEKPNEGKAGKVVVIQQLTIKEATKNSNKDDDIQTKDNSNVCNTEENVEEQNNVQVSIDTNGKSQLNEKVVEEIRVCRKKKHLLTKVKRKSDNKETSHTDKDSPSSKNGRHQEGSSNNKEITQAMWMEKDKITSRLVSDDGEGIVISVEQSDIDSINLD